MESVTIKDKNGKNIEGLAAKDFTITEDGVPQTVSFCEYQTMEEAPEPALTPAPPPPPPAVKVDQVVRTEIAPERPGDLRYRNRRLIVLYFDMGAMPTRTRCARNTPPRSSSGRR